ncbi:hypothetical protein ACFSO0_02465 [Brevibacillus sp. GCM10020057]|uniref:hypothetical protein n=1 Tax=Brevibacillus sp. GCM10020057 TaxID=3317327 RepID=UPI0036281752
MVSTSNNDLTRSRSFHLFSERALDTMNLCGNRGRLSQGELEPKRVYKASNGTNLTLYRPYIDGKYEEITQSDMDVLRVITSVYIERESIMHPFPKPDPMEWVDESRPGAKRKIMELEEIYSLGEDGHVVVVEITPEQIRKRLGGISNKRLPTDKITRSLQRLSQLRVEGIYKVRANPKTLNVSIDGTLLSFDVCKGKNQSVLYMVYFATQWGRLYLNNVQWGNLIHIHDPKYLGLSDGEKNILFPVLAFQFFNWSEDRLLQFLNMKIGKYRKRAIQLLDSYLYKLEEAGYLTWEKTNGTYQVTRLINPTKYSVESYEIEKYENSIARPENHTGQVTEIEVSSTHSFLHEKCDVEMEAGSESLIEQHRRTGDRLRAKSEKTIEDMVRIEILKTVEKLYRKLQKTTDPELNTRIKRRYIEEEWHKLSPFYLWSIDWFHSKLDEFSRYEKGNEISEFFEYICADVELQKVITEWVTELERDYGIPFNTLDTE